VSRRPLLSPSLAARLYEQADAARWDVARDAFVAAVESSLRHAFGDRTPSAADVERYTQALHLADLALASACAAGTERAWEHFVQHHRPLLARAADALDRTGGAQDLADGLYADLYGLRERDGQRQSLFRYYHGRSSLATWLRAVLAQRHVDRVRERRRLEPLDEAGESANTAPAPPPGGVPGDPDRALPYAALAGALSAAVAALAPRDRLRLVNYYAHDMTLAAIGRLLGEHEGTVSRHLSRTRRDLRADIERRLREESGLTSAAIEDLLRAAMSDAGPLDLRVVFGGAEAPDSAGVAPAGKNPDPDRSR
jgi:RNA polymerase sigma-70 factor (ECF subfamily)